jgi:hypothetical protein
VIAGREHSLSGLPTVMQSRAAFFNAPFLLVTLLSVGCTIHVNEVQPKLDRILKDGNEFQYTLVHGNGVHLVKLPGATISLNASETLGNGDYGPENYRKTAHFDVDGHEGPLLHFTFFTDADICVISPVTYQLFAAGVRGAFASIDERYIPRGRVDLHFVRSGPFFAKQTYALRIGRRIELSLYNPCNSATTDSASANAFLLVLNAMHELTHMIDELHPLSQPNPEDVEMLADTAAACVYQSLESLPDSRSLIDLYPIGTYYQESSYGRSVVSPSTFGLCQQWTSYIARHP